jgi:cytosine/uracil/thiamine/allantoin permease
LEVARQVGQKQIQPLPEAAHLSQTKTQNRRHFWGPYFIQFLIIFRVHILIKKVTPTMLRRALEEAVRTIFLTIFGLTLWTPKLPHSSATI